MPHTMSKSKPPTKSNSYAPPFVCFLKSVCFQATHLQGIMGGRKLSPQPALL